MIVVILRSLIFWTMLSMALSSGNELVKIKKLLQYIKENVDRCKGKTVNTPVTIHGTVYTRWGRKACGNGSVQSERIYVGQVAGSDHDHKGAAVNYLCLPQTPIYGHYDSNQNSNAYVFGTKINIWKTDIPGTPFDHAKYHGKSIYCAVCRTAGRASVVMIPGRNNCFPGWTREYHGYLSAGHHTHIGASEYICLDEKPDIFPIKSHSWHKMLYSVEGRCRGLKCPPYVNGRELTCVVCSK